MISARRMRAAVGGLGFLFILALAGCGREQISVKGKITYKDGSPYVGGGQIIFNPVDPAAKSSAGGMIQDDGAFEMATRGATGVPPGDYQIALMPPPLANPNRPPPDWPPFDKKYMRHDQSELTVKVERGMKELDIVVEK